jgi:ABC transporter substrate binding protein
MKIPKLPFTTTDWSQVPSTEHSGETGRALWRTLNIGDVRVRMVEYTPGYLADHCAKRLELLKQIAPSVTRVAVIRDPAVSAGIGELGAIQSVAPSFGVEVSPVNVRDPNDMERAITAFGRAANGGVILTSSGLSIVHRALIG